MARYDGILLCSDFDGTMFCNDRISKENSRAIKYFQENGGTFTIASGRFPEYFTRHLDMVVPNTYIIGLNGAVIFDHKTGKRVFSEAMPRGSQQLAEKIFLDNAGINRMEMFSFNTSYSFTRVTWSGGAEIDELSKVVFFVNEKDSDLIKERIMRLADPSMYEVSRSWINGIELLSSRNTKGKAVRRLAKLLGSRAERVICIGDYENDISMIEEADIGYAVGNAADAVKAAADRVTVPCDRHAIERIISEL